MPKTQPMGGPLFIISLIATWIIAIACVPCTIYLVYKFGDLSLLKLFSCALLGIIFAALFIRGSFSVFLHELKHSILSNFAGNRAKGMKVLKDSGHFEYEFTKDTGKFNPFIALAPYFLPVCTFPALLVAVTLFPSEEAYQLAIVGFCAGVDLLICMRDISPHQTDFSAIRGGFSVGLAYVFAINILFWCLLTVWAVGALPICFKLLLAGIRNHR